MYLKLYSYQIRKCWQEWKGFVIINIYFQAYLGSIYNKIPCWNNKGQQSWKRFTCLLTYLVMRLTFVLTSQCLLLSVRSWDVLYNVTNNYWFLNNFMLNPLFCMECLQGAQRSHYKGKLCTFFLCSTIKTVISFFLCVCIWRCVFTKKCAVLWNRVYYPSW